MNVKVTKGNVLDDLGFTPAEAAELKLKSALARHIQDAIETRGLTQTAAADLTGLRQPEISRIVNYNFSEMSVSRLLKAAMALGIDVEVTLKKHAGDAPGSFEVVA